MSNFWRKLPRPFFALAPMADVTDAAFRGIVAKYGKPHVLFTEFVSCDGLCSEGRKNLLLNLKFSKKEKPIVAQVFGATPAHFTECAKFIRKLGFDGVDINMGCPQRNIEKQGAGAALIKNPKLARAIIRATKAGAGRMPVSIKTRIGYDTNMLKTWLPELLAEKPAAITIHARTRKEMSKVAAHWEAVAEAVKIARALKSKTLIIGNGDVVDLEDARHKAKQTGASGIMIGRAALGTPWVFSGVSKESLLITKRLKVMVEHTKLFERLFKRHKNFYLMRKHYQAYINGFHGARELRRQLMETSNAAEVENIVKKFIKTFDYK